MTSHNHLHNIMSTTMPLLIPTPSVCFQDFFLYLYWNVSSSCQKFKYLSTCAFIQISSDMFVSIKGNVTKTSTGVVFNKVFFSTVHSHKMKTIKPPMLVMPCWYTALQRLILKRCVCFAVQAVLMETSPHQLILMNVSCKHSHVRAHETI